MRNILIFLLLLLFWGSHAWTQSTDFLSRYGDYRVKSYMWDKIKLPAKTYREHTESSQKLADLPSNAYIRNMDSENDNGADGWMRTEYFYIEEHPDCSGIMKDEEAQKLLSEKLQRYLKKQIPGKKFLISARASISERYPALCVKHGYGWIKKENLSDNSILKTEASSLSTLDCDECRGSKNLKSSYSDLKKFSYELEGRLGEGPPPSSSTCGAPGKPIFLNFGGAGFAFEYVKSPKFTYQKKTNSKGFEYSEKKVSYVWSCEVTRIKDCSPSSTDLSVEVAIADKFNKNPMMCNKILELYYSGCSPWKNMKQEERISKVQSMTEEVMDFMRSTKKDFPEIIQPELLQCIARRENHDFDPIRVNYQACAPRTERPSQMTDNFMKGWVSSAFGFSQHVFATVNDYWPWLQNEKVISGRGKTFLEMYGTPENLFKNNLTKDPRLMFQLMALHLEHLAQVYEKKKSPQILDRVILSYDGDKRQTYLPAVKNCVRCITADNDDFECFSKLHGPQSKGVRQ